MNNLLDINAIESIGQSFRQIRLILYIIILSFIIIVIVCDILVLPQIGHLLLGIWNGVHGIEAPTQNQSLQ